MTGRSGRGTARQTVRVDEALWKRFGDARERAGAKDRSAVIREFIRWYVRDRDEQGRPVPMPKRPDAEA
jgi:metal-responsive CopG/Arc/MetJ family transcriptional regulator